VHEYVQQAVHWYDEADLRGNNRVTSSRRKHRKIINLTACPIRHVGGRKALQFANFFFCGYLESMTWEEIVRM